MAQEKTPEAGAGVDLELGGAVPPPAASPYGGIGAGSLVVLAKALPCGAGYYPPFAVVRLQDLPDDFRRQLAGGGGQRAAAVPGGFEAPVPQHGEGAARYLLLEAGHPDVPEGLRRQLAGGVSPPGDRAGYFAVGQNSCGTSGDVIFGNSELRFLRLKDDGGRVVHLVDAAPVPQLPDNMDGGLFELKIGLPAWVEVERSGDLYFDAAAFAREPGAPFIGEAHLDKNGANAKLGALYSNGVMSARENAMPFGALYSNGVVAARGDAVPFVETLVVNNRAAEQGAVYYSDGLVPAPENVMADGVAFPGTRASRDTVQISIDAAVGAKAGDPVARGAEAAGADAGQEHGGGDLSALVGIVAASSAVTAVAAGAVGPAAAFGFFVVLLTGLSLSMASVLGA